MISLVTSGELALAGLPEKAIARIRKALSIKNPKYLRASRMGFSTDGIEERVHATRETPDGALRVPRGALAIVEECLAEDGEEIESRIDDRSEGDSLLCSYLDVWPSLWDFQLEAVLLLHEREQGLVVVGCGGGKSRIGVAAIFKINQATLVIVPTNDIADQWIKDVSRLIHRLDDAYTTYKKIGVLGGGKDTDGQVVVGVANSVVAKLEKDPSWGERFGLVICDECHKIPSSLWQRGIRLLPARYRLGLTATPDREDGLGPMIEWTFGSRLVERSAADLIEAGVLSSAEIEFVKTDFRFDYDGPERFKLSTLHAEIAEDLLRNSMIADRAASDARAGECVLVLANVKSMAASLRDMIAARGVRCDLVTGDVGRKKRAASVEALRGGTLPCVVATQLFDEGVNVPRLSRIHLAFPQRARGATTQRLGRLLRKWPGKKPKLVDYLDPLVPTLVRRAQARKRVYRDARLIP